MEIYVHSYLMIIGSELIAVSVEKSKRALAFDSCQVISHIHIPIHSILVTNWIGLQCSSVYYRCRNLHTTQWGRQFRGRVRSGEEFNCCPFNITENLHPIKNGKTKVLPLTFIYIVSCFPSFSNRIQYIPSLSQ